MTDNELQQLKMAWLAAEDSGDKRAQVTLLRDHPGAQDELIEFIAAYRMSGPVGSEATLLPLTQRAIATAFERVFTSAISAVDLRDLRAQQNLTLVQAARGLRLGIDVWKKFEDGVIDLVSLSERQLERLARFFHISAEQFGGLLLQSQPLPTLDRRQTGQAARDSKQSPAKQSFSSAIAKSSMTKEEQASWQEEA